MYGKSRLGPFFNAFHLDGDCNKEKSSKQLENLGTQNEKNEKSTNHTNTSYNKTITSVAGKKAASLPEGPTQDSTAHSSVISTPTGVVDVEAAGGGMFFKTKRWKAFITDGGTVFDGFLLAASQEVDQVIYPSVCLLFGRLGIRYRAPVRLRHHGSLHKLPSCQPSR
jgi:hypothetical protein